MIRAPWRPILAATALAFFAPGAPALTLGDIEVRSRSGEPLEARIPVLADPGEAFRGACFSIARDATRSLAAEATLELRRRASGAQLFVRTRAPASASPLAFAIAVGCPGTQGEAHPYSIALAAPESQAVPRSPSAAEPRAFPPLPTIASIAADAGDTLASLVRRIFPLEPRARSAYLEAIRASNPALAAMADDEPLSPGTSIALPDLHAFASSRRATGVHVAMAPKPAAAERTVEREPAPKLIPASTPAPTPRRSSAPKPAQPRKAAPPKPIGNPVVASRSAAAETAPAAHPAPAGFRLKLSGPIVDLSPTQAIDDTRRAELRERLLVLEADDRTAEMLSMREAIRKLESRVTDLQLKLARMPVAPARAAAPPAETPPVAATPTAQPRTQPAVAAAAQAPAPKEEPATQAAAPKKPQAMTPAPARTSVIPRAAPASPWYESPWWLPALLALAALLIAGAVIRRRAADGEETQSTEEEPADERTQMIDAPVEAVDLAVDEPEAGDPHAQTLLIAEPFAAAPEPAEDSAELRRRYMEERFPEIVNGALVLDDPDSVVKAARLLYEDGAAPRAIELLQFAIEREPAQKAPWLALFEVFRRERLAGEFARLARRFGEMHAASREWRKVLRIGRDLDPGDALYHGDAAPSFDPASENWLQSGADAGTAVLAGELRGALMADASVTEGDLKADPIPALRKAESFDVA